MLGCRLPEPGWAFSFRATDIFDFPVILIWLLAWEKCLALPTGRILTTLMWLGQQPSSERWHISWAVFRDYLYIPLGGNRRHHLRNLLVWGPGLWHGIAGIFMGPLFYPHFYGERDFFKLLKNYRSLSPGYIWGWRCW